MTTPGTLITLNIRDHGRVNCGYRSFLVLRTGSKWIRLLYPPTLTALRVGAEELAAARPEAVPRARCAQPDSVGREAARGRLRARLKHQAARHRRLGLAYNRALVQEALALLAAPAPSACEPVSRRALGGPRMPTAESHP